MESGVIRKQGNVENWGKDQETAALTKPSQKGVRRKAEGGSRKGK